MNILFLSAGRRIELIQSFIKAKKELGFEGRIFAADSNPLAPALYFADKHFIIPRVSSEDYVSSLYELCMNENISLVIPTIDTELLTLCEQRDSFADTNTRLLVSDRKVIDICRDKYNTYCFFREVGVSTPATYKRIEDVQDSYPLFVKPIDGSSSVNAFKVKNRDELAFFCTYISRPIIQDFIEGEEYTIDVMCDFDGNPIFVTPRKRIATRSGEVSKTQIVNDTTMQDEAVRIVKALKPVGPITIQAIKSRAHNRNYYIEINARFGGGAPLSIIAGANSSKSLMRMVKGEKVEQDIKSGREDLIFLRFDQSIALLKEGEGYSKVRYDNI